jgi:hypothetical protein
MARTEPDRLQRGPAPVAGPAPAEVVSRYCWAFDQHRPDLLEECFTEDAVWEGAVSGSEAVGPIRGRARILEWLSGFWPHQHDQRRHILTNFLVEHLAAETAEIHAYLLLTSAKDGAVSLETTGFYRTQLALVDERWRIRHLFAAFDAPFWPGKVENLSDRGRARHGLFGATAPTELS